MSVRPCLAQRHLPGRLASCLLVLTLITSNEPFIVFGVRCKVVSVSAFVFVKPAAEDCADRPANTLYHTADRALGTLGSVLPWTEYYAVPRPPSPVSHPRLGRSTPLALGYNN